MGIAMHIRDCVPSDATAICELYNHYIENSIATFEEQVVSVSEMKQRIKQYSADYPWIVLENERAEVVGYAYASQWLSRSAFKHTTEITVYIHPEQGNKGFGQRLYETLIPMLSAHGFHVVIAAISLPNAGSIKLHESFGFEKVAHFDEVGYKFDRWIDLGHWQLMLKRNK